MNFGLLGQRGMETVIPYVMVQMLCVMRAWVNLQLLILKMFSLKGLTVKNGITGRMDKASVSAQMQLVVGMVHVNITAQ